MPIVCPEVTMASEWSDMMGDDFLTEEVPNNQTKKRKSREEIVHECDLNYLAEEMEEYSTEASWWKP